MTLGYGYIISGYNISKIPNIKTIFLFPIGNDLFEFKPKSRSEVAKVVTIGVQVKAAVTT